MFKWLKDRYNKRYSEWYHNYVEDLLAKYGPDAKPEGYTPVAAPPKFETLWKKMQVVDWVDWGTKAFLALWPVVLTVFIVIVALSSLYNEFNYLFTRPTPYAVPTGLPGVYVVSTDEPKHEAWGDMEWFTAEEAFELRKQPEVLNFAMIDGRGVKYSTNKSMVFTKEFPWKKVNNPELFQQITVDSTSVTFRYNSELYVLNIGQPFTSKLFPRVISVFDDEGKVWQVNDDTVAMVELAKAQELSIYQVRVNPDLSLTRPNS